MESLTKLKEKIKEQQDEISAYAKENGSKEFAAAAKKVFAIEPQLYKIRWTQYTPRFNDGEPCEFNVHEMEFHTENNEDCYEGDIYLGYHDENLEELVARKNDPNDYSWVEVIPSSQEALEALRDFSGVIKGIDDVMLAIFGDGVEVEIFRDGTVTAEFYDHD